MIRNVVFDLGGVVLGRDFNRLAELLDKTFSFISGSGLDFPTYWSEFDRGMYTRAEVTELLAADKGCTVEQADRPIQDLLDLLYEVPETKALVKELKAAGYGLYILSNMSREFYEHISRQEVFGYFDGAVVSCYEHVNKPDERIYRILSERYGLVPSETIFADDKKINTDAAAILGFHTVTFDASGNGVEQIRRLLDEHRY